MSRLDHVYFERTYAPGRCADCGQGKAAHPVITYGPTTADFWKVTPVQVDGVDVGQVEDHGKSSTVDRSSRRFFVVHPWRARPLAGKAHGRSMDLKTRREAVNALIEASLPACTTGHHGDEYRRWCPDCRRTLAAAK